MLPVFLAFLFSAAAFAAPKAADPCATIGGRQWVLPSEARACLESFPVNETIKESILGVVEKTLAFHTGLNYQLNAPEPFSRDVHHDILADISRIRSTSYPSAFRMHLDLSRSLMRLRDGHVAYFDWCYDQLYWSYIPTPLVLLANENGEQFVHIAPEAYDVAELEFKDQLSVWRDALPSCVTLESLSGAKVLAINGQDPFTAVNANADVMGIYQGLGARQNSFFSSYTLSTTGWNYTWGEFAKLDLPLTDSVDLTIQRLNSSTTDNITLPYWARFDSSKVPFTDSASFWQGNCLSRDQTNGVNVYTNNSSPSSGASKRGFFREGIIAEGKYVLSMVLEAEPPSTVLPKRLHPTQPVGGSGDVQVYLLDDKKTGVLALGSFSGMILDQLQDTVLGGLQTLVQQGAVQLIIDVTNNDGGYACMAGWLHRIIAGPKATTDPQSILDTSVRAGPLAQLITNRISEGADPDNKNAYNPLRFSFANNSRMPERYDWLADAVKKVINGREDAFSQRLGQECDWYAPTPPDKALFDPKKVAIVSNGRCASACTLFSVLMNKLEGSKTVVIGGKKDVVQQYGGSLGGQFLSFRTIDTAIKSIGLKNNTLAPPDFLFLNFTSRISLFGNFGATILPYVPLSLTNSEFYVTWRQSFGVKNPEEPEEWQDHTADVTIPNTVEIVNNPMALWKKVATSVL